MTELPARKKRSLAYPLSLLIMAEPNRKKIIQSRICKRLWGPGIDSDESISPAYVALWAGSTNRAVVPAYHAGNRFLGSLKGLQIPAQLFVKIAGNAYKLKLSFQK
jgi:hypothetical protein